MSTTKKINSYMTAPLITIRCDAPLLEAYKLMYQKRIRHIPVVDAQGVLQGILSDHDVQGAMLAHHGARADEVYLGMDKEVSNYMRPSVLAVSADTDLSYPLKEMLSQKRSAVVVVDEAGRGVGILTTSDVLRILLQHFNREQDLNENAQSYFWPRTLY